MKATILTFLFQFIFFAGIGQTVTVTYDPARGLGPISPQVTGLDQELNVSSSLAALTSFTMSSTTVPAGHKYVVSSSGKTLTAGITADYTSGNKTFTFTTDIIGSKIEIKDDNNAGATTTVVSFTFKKDAPAIPPAAIVPVGAPPAVISPLSAVIDDLGKNYKRTRIGLVEKNAAVREDLDEESAVHIFLDQHGNNLLGTIPQGISNRQYIVHIIFPGYNNGDDNVTYSVRQKSGSFSSALLFNNMGILNQVSNNFHAAEVRRPFETWHEKTFLLGTATDDLTFDVVATTENDQHQATTGVLQTYTIKMSPVYHGSFDIGLINSELRNPDFSLVNSPTNPNEKVVKETNTGSRAAVTVMATFYTSPVILFEKLREKRTGKHVPTYKLTGRNFLDDHRFYERIYPAIGVSINSRTFENLFFGLNWELARGLSIFWGGHWGKVNTFDLPGYQNGQTVVTQEQFDFYTNEKWKVSWAYGANVDLLVITNLFRQ